MLKDKILKSPAVHSMYKAVFYFELGKSQIARVYSWIPDLIIILGGLKYLFKVDFTRTQMAAILLAVAALNTIGGYVLKHSGLWDVDQIVRAKKNAVKDVMYRACMTILNKEEYHEQSKPNVEGSAEADDPRHEKRPGRKPEKAV